MQIWNLPNDLAVRCSCHLFCFSLGNFEKSCIKTGLTHYDEGSSWCNQSGTQVLCFSCPSSVKRIFQGFGPGSVHKQYWIDYIKHDIRQLCCKVRFLFLLGWGEGHRMDRNCRTFMQLTDKQGVQSLEDDSSLQSAHEKKGICLKFWEVLAESQRAPP